MQRLEELCYSDPSAIGMELWALASALRKVHSSSVCLTNEQTKEAVRYMTTALTLLAEKLRSSPHPTKYIADT